MEFTFHPFQILITFLFGLMIMKLLRLSKTNHSTPNLPPGPRKLPILGNLLDVAGPLPHRTLKNLAQKYGPLMHLQLGENSTVVASTAETAKEVMKTHDINFANRPFLLAAHIIAYKSTNIMFSPYGDYWRQLRRICNTELLSAKHVQSLKPIREEEVSQFIHTISKQSGSPMDLSEHIYALTYGITTRSVFGKKLKHQEALISLIDEAIALSGGFTLPDLYPSSKLLTYLSGLRPKLEKIHYRIDQMLEEIIHEHKAHEVGKEDGNTHLLVDTLLKVKEHGSLEIPLTMDNIKAIILQKQYEDKQSSGALFIKVDLRTQTLKLWFLEYLYFHSKWNHKSKCIELMYFLYENKIKEYIVFSRLRASSVCVKSSSSSQNNVVVGGFDFVEVLVKKGLVLAAVCCGVFLVLGCNNKAAVAVASEGVLNGGGGNYVTAGLDQIKVSFVNSLPKILMVLKVFKEQGLILAALLGLSAFFSMAETSITTLWPWKQVINNFTTCPLFPSQVLQVRELAEKESENGVFKMLRNDVTRFLTTILIGTTVVNIGATALVTEAATTIFGEAGVSAATGVMTVAVLLLTEITPKSIAVHNATEVARVVVRPIAWLSLVLYPVGRVVTYLSMGMLKLLGLKGRSEPYVTEDELKLMLRGAELSGAIEEEEQDMIENVLEIKDTYVREVMTPLVDVVASDSSATLIDFHALWVTHQYSRVPVFEQRVDNIVGIAYAMDLLDYVQKGDLLETTTVGDMAHKPAYFVPDSMSVWNLLREFRIRKVHMAVVLNEYGGTVGIVTLEDVVEEIVGEIFDENDSKEEIEKKTGYIVMRAEGIYDVDANTSIDQLSEDLNIKMPEGHQYETVSGFVCEAFGYIPKTGESIKVVLEKEEDHDEYTEEDGDRQNPKEKEKNQVFKIEILAGNARKVGSVRFERVTHEEETTEDVRKLVPKLMKRKWDGDDDIDNENGSIRIEDDNHSIPHHELKQED
ncbi:CBS domain-containing protein / transporter associated domain-containing protein [Artemisia annua]|uniref:CBS domain-containing protein / transporter associated domain-containing protein n=1 Tax=Artemisia annua TaxID=35608 RepID=A0A2U1M0H9_ARTAN|nr:CBS domain-containing protein / transporter associated domain-containing protein [Artemisia annua]